MYVLIGGFKVDLVLLIRIWFYWSLDYNWVCFMFVYTGLVSFADVIIKLSFFCHVIILFQGQLRMKRNLIFYEL